MKRVPHSLFSSVATATLGTAFFIAFLVGFAWLVRADIILLNEEPAWSMLRRSGQSLI